MKKNLFIIILSILSSSSYAQLVDGLPFNFSSLNGIQYNPGYHPLEENPSFSNMWVAIREEEDLSKSERVFLQTCFEEDYPGHTILAPPTVSYNCHGYSHSISQGGDVCNVCWSSELCNNGFVLVQTPEKGDIAVIRTIENNLFEPASIHSSIVVNEDTLISKWGEDALTKHHKNDVIGIGQLGTVNVYTYYRRVINTPNNISGPYVFNGTGSFIFYPDYLNITSCSWSVEPAAMFQVSSGTGYTANLSYKTPFEYLAPKATITFTFSYGCDNHYTVSKEFDLRIPTTTISGNAISEGFILDANAVVTVTGTIKSNKNAKTIVPVGTRLILDGGLMTNNDNNFWQGIEVWGNKNVHQYEINGSYGQGYLELKNGAVIENANCAVELWRPNYWGTTGGIIHATDATFRNCAKAVHALYYTNHSYINGLETAYNSSFKNCNFIIDENYLGSQTFNKHVDLAHVNGISFKGCAFSVNRKIQGVSLWCVGIGAYQAGFTVSSFCNAGNSSTTTEPCPEEYLVPSTFSGFYHGIHASNDGSAARTFNVWNSILSNNTIGIFALNTGYATIVNNEFVVGCGSDCDFGIYAEAVTGFCIEENSFYPRAINHGSPYGIEIVGSLGNNDIYGNHFQGLHCGNVAVGNNIVTSESSMANTLGLTYSCNTNTNNTIDFCVLKDSNGHGDIAPQQGSMYQPSGNTFNGDLYHFYNDGSQLIDYYYNTNENSQIPDPDLLYRVSRHSTTSPNQCTSHYGNSSLVKSNSEKNQLATDYLSHYTTYSNLKQLYENKIDGGNTSLQVSDINNASTSDQWRLRAHLLELAPYTSADVLTATIDRYDVFSNPVLFEILSANPDELKKDTLIRYLENKENPLPDYMVDILRQVADGFTARTALEAQMGKYGHDYTLAAGDIVRSNLNDSIADPTELRTWLGNTRDLASDRMVVASYLQEGDSLHAFTLANLLPDLYGLQGNDLADHSDYMDLLRLYHSLYRENRTVFELDEAETTMIDSIANFGIGASKSMAKALLSELSDDYIITSYCPSMPEAQGNNSDRNRTSALYTNEHKNHSVNVSPNPATTWTVIDYILPQGFDKLSFTLTNIHGVQVLNTFVYGNQGQKTIDLQTVSPGIYFYTISYGEYAINGKIVITE